MKTVNLIVYGTLMSGECNHCFCQNAISISPCSVTGTIYDTGFGYPAFVPEGNFKIQAELIVIPEEDWQPIDQLEEYPDVYDRQIISALLPDGTSQDGWIYIMNKLPVHAQIIQSGNWKQRD